MAARRGTGPPAATAVSGGGGWILAYPLGGDTRGLWLGLLIGLATTAVLLLRRYGTALNARAATAPATAEAGT
ncbi:hypothetical protein [Streptomyces vinaceus]|uniref:hypothetical protein n=1 Tax=Streptomyces vinaceus TaxID=1960 RepID=UPI0036C58A98